MNTFMQVDTLYLPRPARLTARISSRLRSPDIDVETVRAVLDLYGLQPTGRLENLPNARRNRNLIAGTQAGRKVLKLYRRDWSMDTIVYEHSILRRLAEVNFPAPRLLATSIGRTFVSNGGKNYCMFEFVGGLNYSWTFLLRPHRMRLMRTAGRTLARLHRQLSDFEPLGGHHLGFVSRRGERLRDLEWHIRKVSELKARSKDLNEPAVDWLIARSGEILDEISQLTCVLKDAGLPRTIIHGDFGLHNLLFKDADQAIPMDFELARLEWRLSDLVSCLSKLRTRKGAYDMESVEQLLAAYQQESPIGDEEWRWFPLVWKHYKLAKAVQYWSSYFETDGPVHKLSLAKDAAEQSNWLLDDPQLLGDLRLKMGQAG